jgi:hypothetical protein
MSPRYPGERSHNGVYIWIVSIYPSRQGPAGALRQQTAICEKGGFQLRKRRLGSVERVFTIHIEAFDWNCQQHITPRFTEEQIRDALSPVEKRMQMLEHENQKLKDELVLLKTAPSVS